MGQVESTGRDERIFYYFIFSFFPIPKASFFLENTQMYLYREKTVYIYIYSYREFFILYYYIFCRWQMSRRTSTMATNDDEYERRRQIKIAKKS